MGYGKRSGSERGSGGISKKKAKPMIYASWAAGGHPYKDRSTKIKDGTIGSMIATGLSLPEISKKLFPHHNPTSFNTTVKKAKVATGFLVGNGMKLSFLLLSKIDYVSNAMIFELYR